MACSVEEALATIEKNGITVGTELLPIESAIGRVSAQEIEAVYPLPRFDNSAMDGFAVCCEDAGKRVSIAAHIYAGDRADVTLTPQSAHKIMTGAPIPQGCEAIVPIEACESDGTTVVLPETIKKGNFIRKRGEDIAVGDMLLRKGEQLTSYTIAALATQGVTHLSVHRKPIVAIFGTGNELKPHFAKIEAHELYNSNTPMLIARCQELGCETRYIRAAEDSPEALKAAIDTALRSDLILTTGGISKGDKDFTIQAFIEKGMKLFYEGVAIRPGRPSALGRIGDTMIFNLPGNPLAAMVNFELFVRPLIAKLRGQNARYHGTVRARLGHEIALKGGVDTVKLGYFDGSRFKTIDPQKPGMVSPLPRSNAMILVKKEDTVLQKDTEVRILPISWEFFKEERGAIYAR